MPNEKEPNGRPLQLIQYKIGGQIQKQRDKLNQGRYSAERKLTTRALRNIQTEHCPEMPGRECIFAVGISCKHFTLLFDLLNTTYAGSHGYKKITVIDAATDDSVGEVRLIWLRAGAVAPACLFENNREKLV